MGLPERLDTPIKINTTTKKIITPLGFETILDTSKRVKEIDFEGIRKAKKAIEERSATMKTKERIQTILQGFESEKEVNIVGHEFDNPTSPAGIIKIAKPKYDYGDPELAKDSDACCAHGDRGYPCSCKANWEKHHSHIS